MKAGDCLVGRSRLRGKRSNEGGGLYGGGRQAHVDRLDQLMSILSDDPYLVAKP